MKICLALMGMAAAMVLAAGAPAQGEDSGVVSRLTAPFSAITYSGAACGNWVAQVQSGSFTFRWCANRLTVSGVAYEVQRDIYQSVGGSLRLQGKLLLDCQNGTDYSSLPAGALPLCP